MKQRRTAAPKKDLTGLVCTAGMGLLVLLAWATLPALPLLQVDAPPLVSALAHDIRAGAPLAP